MGRLKALLVLLLLAPAAAQEVPTIVGDTLEPVLDPVARDGLGQANNETGEDFTSEEIDLDIALQIRNVEYSVVGILFGGGKVQADIDADLHLEFRAVSMERLDDALRAATGEANASVQAVSGVPIGRAALTAEEIRVAGSGVVLAALQAQQEQLATRLLEETVPGMTVLKTTFAWSNTLPGAWASDLMPEGSPDSPDDIVRYALDDAVPELREPPLVLDASLRLQFLDRISLGTILKDSQAGNVTNATGSDREPPDVVKKRIQANEMDPLLERSAFQILGYGQLLDFRVPPGWRVGLRLEVPAGYTVEGVTDELVLRDDHLQASYFLDGQGTSEVAAQAGIVSVSSRFTVTVFLLVVVILVGIFLRIPTEAIVMAAVYRRTKGRRPSLRKRWRARRAAFSAGIAEVSGSLKAVRTYIQARNSSRGRAAGKAAKKGRR